MDLQPGLTPAGGVRADPLPATRSSRATGLDSRPRPTPPRRSPGRTWRLLPAILPAVGDEPSDETPTGDER